MAIVETSITPIGTGTPSVSKYVAKCHEVLKEYPDLEYQLTPMGTILEGDLSKIFEAIEKMHEVPFDNGASRVSTLIKVDDRRDKKGTMEGKMRSVLDKL
ncbi:MTH1187 family thiamine-binding protein [Isachenkonia alkalipeptolytica]|uniref:MTH1187 family thiamine-binding protein n=1 Tax=Isachenkonia alkalipeptolytica TaxID=2565777 RepID=A0AA44BE91_9CLOT|nr:MTH1187 family thiamine-binding protein [Isachenkonia alkalipeptolytica]NBG88678.1 MTH1187 family thiamine-binding protein [Isachenkonia alkalipeptolytica]